METLVRYGSGVGKASPSGPAGAPESGAHFRQNVAQIGGDNETRFSDWKFVSRRFRFVLMKPHFHIPAAVAALALAATAAQAQEPQEAGTFGKWTAYHYTTKKGPVCYIVSRPVKSEASRKNIRRDPAYFLVTHRPGEKVRGEINTIIGYTFKKGAPVTLKIDGTTFTLFSTGDGAWSEGPATDRKIVAAMKAGRTMTVTGTSSRGTRTVDTYDLTGVTAALKKIGELCKMR